MLHISPKRFSQRYLYDDRTSTGFMYFWEDHSIDHCTKVAYEDIFHAKLLKPRKQE